MNLVHLDLVDALDRDGYIIIPNLLPSMSVDSVVRGIEDFLTAESVQAKPHGIRNLASRVPAVRTLAEATQIREFVERLIGGSPRLVRSILFDKVAGANWAVPWHQDQTIAVQERVEAAGYGPWTVKEGIPSVQPPTEILESMVTLRIHLDDCAKDNGPLRVIPGSHKLGRLSAEAIDQLARASPGVDCTVGKGGVLVMRPLLLHASSPSGTPIHRRVVHLDFANRELPCGLRWNPAA